ncbi:MAG: T9SS type A sorting domain-containing protein, partial [Flavobacteriales bacterium]
MKVDNGCGSDSIVKTLTVRDYPTTTISPGDTTICDGSSITLSINGGTSYAWSSGGATQSVSVSPTATTQYWGVASNANCIGDTAYVTITNNRIPNVTANANPTLVCLGSAIYFSMTGSNAITYDWDYGDGTTSSAPNASHIYSAPGTYIATVKGTFGLCDSSNSIQVIVNDCTGLEEESLASSIVVYPNPANRFLNISILESEMENVKMAIFNSSGNMVHSSLISSQTEQTTIDINSFSEGVYLIRFNSENKVVTKKLIVVK